MNWKKRSEDKGKTGKKRPFARVAELLTGDKRELIARILKTVDPEDTAEKINPSKEDVPLIAEFLNDEDPNIRKAAAYTLIDSSSLLGLGLDISEAIPYLIEAFRKFPEERLTLINTMHMAYMDGADVSSAYGDLEEALNSECHETKITALEMFSDMIKNEVVMGDTVKAIVKLLNDDHQDVRSAAMKTLTKAASLHQEIDNESLPMMRRFLCGNNDRQRVLAIEFFSCAIDQEQNKNGPGKAFRMVIGLTQSDDPLVAEAARKILGPWIKKIQSEGN
ncbi:HEAT repeat domain-containing protein [Candidatus Micrarchaeota archaeon]|nr:HEAT repeat domain-containing protein [Candidatus Micrarchaeota archaeon]